MARRKKLKGMVTDLQIGSRLRARRLQQGLSQNALGSSVGVSYQQIQKYETGKNAMNLSMAQVMAAALDVPVSYFLQGDEA